MNKVEAIEREVRSLSPEELAAFRAWFLEFDADAWDRQIEADARAGKLDALAEQAMTKLEDAVKHDLLRAGAITEISSPDRSRSSPRVPIEVRGQPLSEMIIDERR